MRFASTRALQFPRHVTSACEEAGDGNVLVGVFPVQAKAGEFDLLALLPCGVEQARKPCERHTDGAASVRSTHIVYSSKQTAIGEAVTRCSQDRQHFPPQI
jgi:hypothetical protein